MEIVCRFLLDRFVVFSTENIVVERYLGYFVCLPMLVSSLVLDVE